jgi:hypothetical protein
MMNEEKEKILTLVIKSAVWNLEDNPKKRGEVLEKVNKHLLEEVFYKEEEV